VTDARWSIVGVPPELSDARYEDAVPARLLRFDVCAQAFCHQMVRSMVGLLVLVGRGRRPAADVPWLLASGRRQSGVPLAPASGLCLVSVDYS
jgi:tRNA pseudouridine(38-40) synthase